LSQEGKKEGKKDKKKDLMVWIDSEKLRGERIKEDVERYYRTVLKCK